MYSPDECSIHSSSSISVTLYGMATVESTSDERVVNNLMRHQYKVLSEEEKVSMQTMKDFGLNFCNFIDTLGQSLEYSLAKTKVEEAIMWSVKGLTK